MAGAFLFLLEFNPRLTSSFISLQAHVCTDVPSASETRESCQLYKQVYT